MTMRLCRIFCVGTIILIFGGGERLLAQCPDGLGRDISQTALEEGGVFYKKAVLGGEQWAPLAEEDFSISRSLELVYVPSPAVCASPDNPEIKRPDCGPHGFFLAKVHRVIGEQQSSDTVQLEHGTSFSAVSGFKSQSVDNELYQHFHTSRSTQFHRILSDAWHQPVPWRDTSHDETFEPFPRKAQFSFSEEELRSGTREARLFRFDPPPPGHVVCVPFTVGMPRSTSLNIEIVLLEPVFSDTDYFPLSYDISH